MLLPSLRPKPDAEIKVQRFSQTGCPCHDLWAVLLIWHDPISSGNYRLHHKIAFSNDILLVRGLGALICPAFGRTEVMKSPLASSRDRTSSCREWCEHRHTFSTATQMSTEQPETRELSGGDKGHATTSSGARAALPLAATLGTGVATERTEMEDILPEARHTVSTLSTPCIFPQRELPLCSTQSCLQLAKIFVSHDFGSLSAFFNNTDKTPGWWQRVAGETDPFKAKQPLSHAYSPMGNKCLWFCRCRRIGYAAEAPIGTMHLWRFWSQGGCRGKSPLTVSLWEAQGFALYSNVILDNSPHSEECITSSVARRLSCWE